MRLSASLAALSLSLSLSLAPAPQGAAQAAEMAAHRALYRLSLASSRAGDLVAASGTMGYEVIDACDGWAVRQRLDMTITNRDGQDIQMVSDYSTWESKDGLSLRFHMKQTTETAVTSETDGDAKLEPDGGPGEARYTLPRETSKPLPAGTLLPMAHTEALLAAAREGRRFLAVPLFDGTAENGAQDSFTTILGWDQPKPQEKWPALASLPSARVRISFFDRTAAAQTPDYQVGMRYWANGVADDLQMDFGDFAVNGTMTEFALQPNRC